jgi:hypothetical protein
MTVVLGLTSGLSAHAAVVAVMPVQGVNLTEGQADAIGVLFANAMARETNVQVVSPLDSKPLLGQGQSAAMVANHLGVREYVELRAVQLGSRITLSGARFTKDGQEIFRSETGVAGMDDMEAGTTRLARSLAWRLPVARQPAYDTPATDAVAVVPPPAPTGYPKALGIKTGITFAKSWESTRSYAPMVSFQFAGRMGTRDAFVEFGAGLTLPASSAASSRDIQMGGVFAEIGGGVFLAPTSVAPYLAGGISPRIWVIDAGSGADGTGASCTVYGAAGINFTRDARARLYGEFRVSQYLLGLRTKTSYYYNETADGSVYYPTELSLNIGIGW